MEKEEKIRVFISYSHDSLDHKSHALTLSNHLRADGVDCTLDQYEFSPPEGWPQWMVRNITGATFVLIICSENYYNRISGLESPQTGLGAKWEGAIITQEIYNSGGQNTKFIPVFFKKADQKFIPKFLENATYYDLSTNNGYDNLYRHITDQPVVKKPPIGKIKKQFTLPHTSFEKQNKNETPSNAKNFNSESLILIHSQTGEFYFIPSKKVESSKTVVLNLQPSDTKASSFLNSLQSGFQNKLGIAFGFVAITGILSKIVQKYEKNVETWELEINREDIDHSGGFMEASFEEYSPDDFAELRARRILLNDPPAIDESKSIDQINSSMKELFIRGNNSTLEVVESPFPKIYKNNSDDIPTFLSLCRLVGVYFLVLSGAVENIFKLDLKLNSQNDLVVDFEGRRHKKYSNLDAPIIRFNGVCKLN
jgi:TIR domain-containing protein